MNPCWLCGGVGHWFATDIKRSVTCGMCAGAGEYEPLPKVRPYIMAEPGVVRTGGNVTLTETDFQWAQMWSIALRGE